MPLLLLSIIKSVWLVASISGEDAEKMYLAISSLIDKE
jgi:hypothetical protein